MRALAPPPGRVRQAAAQGTDQGVSRALLSKRGSMGTAGANANARFQARYMDWQPWAKRFSRQVGAASFQAQVISDLSARCDIFVEERTGPDEWKRSEDARFAGVMELYRNELQDAPELVRHQAWHYNVAGEMVLAARDGVSGMVDYSIHSCSAVDWDKPGPGLATVRLVPDGKVTTQTAFVIPRAQLVRFWVPDHEWPGYAWSPMAAAVDDLKRWRSLARYAMTVSDSALAMSGILWAPGEAFEGGEEGDGADGVADGGGGVGTPKAGLEDQYYDLARLRFSESDDVTAVAPTLMHWDKDYGKPEWVKVGEGLDEQGIAHRKEALEDFARATNLPASSVVGGGVGDGNHWSEWLATDKMIDSGVKPTMDRITHLDLTRAFLWPLAVVSGFGPEQLVNIRIGYDTSPIVVKPDLSANAQKLGPMGILKFETILEANGFDEGDLLTDPGQREWLLEVLSHGTAGGPEGGPAPVSSASTSQTPPARPMAMAAAVGELPSPVVADDATPAAGAAVLRSLTRLRQSVGTKLIAEAQAAYEGAIRAGGAKVKTRARGRMSGTRAASICAAVDRREALEPFLAAVKISDLELLESSFDTFRSRALAELGQYRRSVAAVLADAGLAEVPIGMDTTSIEQGVDFIVAGLTAMARARLMAGDEAILAAARDLRHLAPRAPRRPAGFVDEIPGLPDPDELAGAAARLVRNALAVTEGRASMTMPTTPDGMPTATFTLESPVLEDRIGADLGVAPNWTWAHGFYGEPASPFEPHEMLDGYTTTDRDHDPELANLDAWPDVDVFAPNDHPGCTCEWVPAG